VPNVNDGPIEVAPSKDKIKIRLSLQLTKKKWVPHKNSQTPQNKFWVSLYSYF
jgi:hypothetical protein